MIHSSSRDHLPQRSQKAVADLLAKTDHGSDFNLLPLGGGANNKVFRVDVDGSFILLKVYFHHRLDQRDRLGAEFSFVSFAWKNGIRSVPRPIACDPKHRLGLYEFIEGPAMKPNDITDDDVGAALRLFHDVNRHKHQKEAQDLPCASESCFTVLDNLECVEHRIERLMTIGESTAIDRDATRFIRNDLYKLWKRVYRKVSVQSEHFGIDLNSHICSQDKCLSHSDFGFHNAIKPANGVVRFIDFEYAGWDDPAKMVCDFFSAPEVPVPMGYRKDVTESVASELQEPESYFRRVELLMPVHQLKWYCILLNDFLPVGFQRRTFARGKPYSEEHKAQQLQRTCAAVAQLSEQIVE